ncbi:uncharacterized protein LOC100371892 [Saccoglossus kowalevskii]|uniref:Uncharacterized protein LOC100371892 n=1 Tax=Saccoglossus kowalevskii TaxID=10224 RepID=A0ABM0GXK5_SACKO|nr:PREDICTED: uncharacterized protein LOC100371892 [Saccoglossus kowalevskii]
MSSVGIIALLYCLLSSTFCQPLTKQTVESLNEFIKTTMNCKNVTGLTVSLVRGDDTVFAEGFGSVRLDGLDAVTNTTLFNIGSVSKTFTSTVAADAIGRKLSTWDTPFRSILGDSFWMQGLFRTELVNLRDVLAHKSGIANYWGVSTAALGLNREELVRRMRFFEDSREFRSRWLYSNYMYTLAGYVTEVLTGESWETSVNKLFDSLGMVSSRVSADMSSSDWSKTCYSRIDSLGDWIEVDEAAQVRILDEIAPAAGIFSNAVDMAEFMKFHLRYGKNKDGDQIVDEGALRDTYTPTFTQSSTCCLYKPTYPIDDTRTMYGMGWYKGSYRGYEKNYHTGSYSAYYCRISLFHSMNAGVFVCVNSPGDDRGYDTVHEVSMQAYDYLLGYEPWLNTSTGCTFPSPWTDASYAPMPPMTNSPHPLLRPFDDYVGQYGHYAFGNFTVLYDEMNNQLRYEFGFQLQGTLSASEDSDLTLYMRVDDPVAYREYFYSTSFPYGWPVYFKADDNNNIINVSVPYLENDWPFMFMRDIKMSDAPMSPPIHDNCEVNNAGRIELFSVAFVYFHVVFMGEWRTLSLA